jgi:V/A-type H+-transporting ATPase subunit I
MQRTLIVASKGYQVPVIETLHRLRVAHFIDYQEKGGEFAEFRLGAPLPPAGPASERLVRVRALLRHLGIEGAVPGKPLRADETERRLDEQLDAIERDVNAAHEARESLRRALDEGRELDAKLEPLRTLSLNLDDYRGYESLSVFVGRAAPAFEAAVMAAAPDAMLVRSSQPEGVFALFVPRAQAQAASEALYKNGYAEVEVPQGTGSPDDRLRALVAERASLEARAKQAEADLQRLAAQHKDFLLAAEEQLAIVVEKAEAPLSFASTEHAFVVDAWIPSRQVNVVEASLRHATMGNVHIQVVATGESARAEAHAHAAHHAHADSMTDATVRAPTEPRLPPDEPPTKYANPGGVRQFQWFTDLFATPRYDEVDPTLVLATVFPLFFGFMIGDLGLGVVLALVGWLLIKKLPRVDGMKQLGAAFVVAGLVAAILGAFVFTDAFGIALGATPTMTNELNDAGLAHTCANLYDHVKEATWSCLLTNGHSYAQISPLIEKSGKDPVGIRYMLVLSIVAGGLHLLLGMILGLRNETGHGPKHVGAKVGYLLLLLAFYPAALALMGLLPSFATPTEAYLLAGGGFVLGAVILGWAEGMPGVFEIPTVFSNIFSYLRLGAVGIAKGAMAVAFNGLTLVAIGLSHHDTALFGLFLVLGLIAFVIVQAILFVLGVLSAGIQAIRLNFVEFFTKFYKGGGKPYKPFGRERSATTAVTTASPSTP